MAGGRIILQNTFNWFVKKCWTATNQLMSESLQAFKDSISSRVDHLFANDEIGQVTRSSNCWNCVSKIPFKSRDNVWKASRTVNPKNLYRSEDYSKIVVERIRSLIPAML